MTDFNQKFAKRLIQFTVSILRFADKNEYQKKYFLHPVLKQLIRSAGSVGANVTEAHGANSKKDFAHFFQIALKSAKETKYWLLVVREYDKNVEDEVNMFIAEITEFIKIITSSLVTMRKGL